MVTDAAALRDFAARYTAAWCGQDPAAVAAFFAPGGSLRVNHEEAAVGRAAIAAVAQSFMTAFPDLHVAMDDLVVQAGEVVYHWTLTGTNTGPGGTGRQVRISGFEQWRMDPGGLIAASQGRFDDLDYRRQLNGGT